VTLITFYGNVAARRTSTIEQCVSTGTVSAAGSTRLELVFRTPHRSPFSDTRLGFQCREFIWGKTVQKRTLVWGRWSCVLAPDNMSGPAESGSAVPWSSRCQHEM